MGGNKKTTRKGNDNDRKTTRREGGDNGKRKGGDRRGTEKDVPTKEGDRKSGQ